MIFRYIIWFIFMYITLPIVWLITFVSYHTFRKFKRFSHFDQNIDCDISKIHDDLKKKFENEEILEDIITKGDSAKFLGIVLASTNSTKVLKYILKYIGKNGFNRRPGSNKIPFKPFSGDMFAGYMYGVIRYLNHVKDQDEISFAEDLVILFDDLERVLEISLKEGRLYSRSVRKDRGFLIGPFVSGGHILPLLITLEFISLYRKLRFKEKIIYFLAKIWLRILSTASPAFFFRIGKYYYVEWYHIHSTVLMLITMYELTKDKYYLKQFEKIYNKFDCNPEYIALAIKYNVGNIIEEDKQFVKNVICYKGSNTVTPAVEIRYNIKNVLKYRKFEPEVRSEECLIPPLIYSDYIWEDDLTDLNKQKLSPLTGAETLHLISLINKTI